MLHRDGSQLWTKHNCFSNLPLHISYAESTSQFEMYAGNCTETVITVTGSWTAKAEADVTHNISSRDFRRKTYTSAVLRMCRTFHCIGARLSTFNTL